MQTIVVAGGGYAGIHAIKALKAESERLGTPIRIVLLDPSPYHLKKVRLVQAAAVPTSLRVPWSELFPAGEAEYVQGRCLSVDGAARTLRYADASGAERAMAYDRLVLALGSVVRDAPEGAGGIALRDEAAAERIRRAVEANLSAAASERNPDRRAALCAVVVAGGGISGVETAAELAKAMKRQAAALGLPSSLPSVAIAAGGPRLVPLMSDAAARRLEARVRAAGVRILRGVRVERGGEDGFAALSDGRRIPCSLVVWTIGVDPSPALRGLGLPLGEDGRLVADSWYRVQGGYGTIYAIGDNARVVDSATGIEDGMTCREAIQQAVQLGRALLADAAGRPAAPHRAATRQQYCVDLGEGEGFAWIRHWGVDMTIGGKLGGKVREYTWNLGSLMK
ncbi:NAD(P)/FAD-dependent oxidoreductase [Paenibacillus sp.]|uniref:NAD(P)/FAD-dependent oxidoreductase n=1 Tax=Paenibacillus sp. TaxID=58172 RepID=UPI002D675B56|nr:FAD-dependent oxidoreductase [Paenibacillus sp.]HZG58013.1 FAD-dependent oxidoreductase [Paenibacillus sp.]